MKTLSAFHNATRVIDTKGLVSNGRQLRFAQTFQIGFEGWVRMKGIAGSL